MSGAPSILFVNSGSPIKYFTLEKAKEIGWKTHARHILKYEQIWVFYR